MLRERTIADVAAGLAPGLRCEDLFAWPPDGFAFTAGVLAESGAYRLIVSPPNGRRWPPDEPGAELWEAAVHRWAREWTAWAIARRPGVRRPAALSRLTAAVRAARHLPLTRLDEPESWEVLVALLTLHAMADEACAGLGVDSSADDHLHLQAASLLHGRGTLARIAGSRARVLPKSSLPRTGITIRSLSRYVGLDRSETEVRWYQSDAARCAASRLTLLLVPYPTHVAAGDFRAIRGPLDNMDPDQFGFFEFAPRRPLDVDGVLRAVEAAATQVGGVDVVVLPEAVLQPAEAEGLRRALATAGVAHLVAGVREHAGAPNSLGGNYAYVTGVRDGVPWAQVQHKHHRWSLDDSQIRQYHLERRLHPGPRWWEAIGVERRSLMFVTIDRYLTLCPLICEDLAQPDPVGSIIRQVGPSLLIALLLDGPQLAGRWPARYASVFADDPGCAVLTLTSLGMARRCVPPGLAPSRSVALWKDASSGIRELNLADGAAALALTAAVDHRFAMTADGRGVPTAHLLLQDVRQVAVSGARAGRRSRPATAEPASNGERAVGPDGCEPAGSRPLAAAPDVRSDDAVFVCDRDTRILAWNRAAERITGIPATRAIGRRCPDVIRGRDDTGRLVCTRDCVVGRRARRGRPLTCPPLVLETADGPRRIGISTVIVREREEPLVVHVARELPLEPGPRASRGANRYPGRMARSHGGANLAETPRRPA